MGKTINKKIEIGNKLLKNITCSDLKQLLIIEGVIPSLNFWKKPTITNKNNSMFSDTIVVDYYSMRIEDNRKSVDYVFFFNYKDFSFHYTQDYENNKILMNFLNHRRNGKLRLDAIKFLIKKGYDVPLY